MVKGQRRRFLGRALDRDGIKIILATKSEWKWKKGQQGASPQYIYLNALERACAGWDRSD